MRKSLKVCWISAGVSSFVAGWLVRDTVDKYIYIDVEDQHADSIRFVKDCESAFGKPIEILKSSKFKNVDDVVRKYGVIMMRSGFAPCTNQLKKQVRHEWEAQHADFELTYVWGIDPHEKHRAERMMETMPEFYHEFPLIDQNVSKEKAHQICRSLGIVRPLMYRLGYNNNNCIGCVKGGMGYWNKIREDFPDVFESRAKLERDVGYSIIKGVYLDELEPTRGRLPKEIMDECLGTCGGA